jgi:phosphatidyl-myo-inositol dimannoside synthase
VGLSGVGCNDCSIGATAPLLILALVTEAFGGRGGIAQYNRDLLSALVRCDGGAAEIVVLPRFTPSPIGLLPSALRQLAPVENKVRYSLAAVATAVTQRPFDLIFCGHLFMAPLAAAISKALNIPLWLQIHGVEAWHDLSALQRRSVETAALVTTVSRDTRRRLLKWAGINPNRVKVVPNTVDARYQPGPKPDYLLERHAVRGKKILLTVSRLSSLEWEAAMIAPGWSCWRVNAGSRDMFNLPVPCRRKNYLITTGSRMCS